MVDKLIGYEQEILRGDILSIQINLLNKCTSRCKSCKKYTWPNDMLGFGDIKNTIDVLVNHFGLRTAVLSGGDPVLYPEFPQVVEYLGRYGVLCSMITTGITTRKDVIDTMSEKMFRIHISMDACDSEMYKNIRGVNGFNVADTCIHTVSKRRIANGLKPIRLSSTISNMNCHMTYELYRYAKSRGCQIKFFFVHTFEEFNMSCELENVFYSQLERVYADELCSGMILSNAKELLDSRFEQVEQVGCNCYVPHMSCVINANGDIYPCCRVFKDNGFYGEQVHLAYGNIVGKTREELVEQFEKRMQGRYPICDNEECKECGQRYQALLQHLCRIKEPDKREALFI